MLREVTTCLGLHVHTLETEERALEGALGHERQLGHLGCDLLVHVCFVARIETECCCEELLDAAHGLRVDLGDPGRLRARSALGDIGFNDLALDDDEVRVLERLHLEGLLDLDDVVARQEVHPTTRHARGTDTLEITHLLALSFCLGWLNLEPFEIQ